MTPQRIARINEVINKRQPDITILMENIHDPHNISAVMRTCEAIGMINLYILNTVISEHKKFGTKSSSSALKWLKVHQFNNMNTCVATIKAAGAKLYATNLHNNAVSLYNLNLTENICLVFGNEKDGVSAELLAHCSGNFIIPQVGMIQSLNISVACAVSLYEAFRQKTAAGHYIKSRLPLAQKNIITNEWMILADSSKTAGLINNEG